MRDDLIGRKALLEALETEKIKYMKERQYLRSCRKL